MDLFGAPSDDPIEGDTTDSIITSHNDGLNDPKAMSFCLGHEDQENLFIELYNKNSLPHAMIFSGLEGIGKTTMAFRLVHFLLKNGKVGDGQGGLFGEALPTEEITSLDVDPNDPVFRRVVSGGHADFLHIHRAFDKAKGKQDASLKVEAIRKIEPFLRKTASEGGWRIVLVEDADTMNRNAQNAILKILEEPPANVLIILIAHRPGMLIPTIHSRSRTVAFSSLSAETMQTLISKKEGLEALPSDIDALADLSEGSVGQALKYLEYDGLDMMQRVLDHMDHANDGDLHKIHEISASLSTPAQDASYRMFVNIIQWIIRKTLLLKSRGIDDIPSYIKNDTTSKIFNEYPLDKLIGLTDSLQDNFKRVDLSNLDRRDAVRSAFLMISQ